MKALARLIFRVSWESIQGFIHDDCFNKASALTFYTLLSIVPILAVAFGIANGLGFEKYLETEVSYRLLDQPVLAQKITAFAYTVLNRTHGGIIAVVGVISLLWTSIQLLGNIEYSLNVIWGVKKARSYVRQARDYLLALILCAIFFVVSSGISVLTIAEIDKIAHYSAFVKAISPYLLLSLKLIPFIINSVMFSFIYIYMPNTNVRWKYAIMGGLIAGIVYQIVEWIYIHFQIGVANYGAIYGSFAALPLFLVWINTSWCIVLGGAEIARALEIIPKISAKDDYQFANKKIIGLWMASYCTQEFLQGGSPVSIHQLAAEIGATLTTIQKIGKELCQAGILVEDQKHSYLIAKNPDDIKLHTVLDALDEELIEQFPIKASPQVHYFDQSLQKLEDSIAHSSANISLKDLTIKI